MNNTTGKLCPQEELNSHLTLRTGLLCPLSYEGLLGTLAGRYPLSNEVSKNSYWYYNSYKSYNHCILPLR